MTQLRETSFWTPEVFVEATRLDETVGVTPRYSQPATVFNGRTRNRGIIVIEPHPASDTDANSDNLAQESSHHTEPEPSSRPTKVLILEDEPTLLELISEMLALRGMDVTPTNTVAAARHQLTLATFDLFLTDIVVQGEFSGASLAKEAQEQGQAARVVVMSGHPKQRALAGQDNTERLRFLKKPFSYDELINIVSTTD